MGDKKKKKKIKCVIRVGKKIPQKCHENVFSIGFIYIFLIKKSRGHLLYNWVKNNFWVDFFFPIALKEKKDFNFTQKIEKNSGGNNFHFINKNVFWISFPELEEKKCVFVFFFPCVKIVFKKENLEFSFFLLSFFLGIFYFYN